MKYAIENKERVREYVYGKDKRKQKVIYRYFANADIFHLHMCRTIALENGAPGFGESVVCVSGRCGIVWDRSMQYDYCI